MLYFILRPTASLVNSTVWTGSACARTVAGKRSQQTPNARRENRWCFIGITTPEKNPCSPSDLPSGFMVTESAVVSRNKKPWRGSTHAEKGWTHRLDFMHFLW